MDAYPLVMISDNNTADLSTAFTMSTSLAYDESSRFDQIAPLNMNATAQIIYAINLFFKGRLA